MCQRRGGHGRLNVRLLLTGASGLLGGRLAALLTPRHALAATRHRGPLPPGVEPVDADLSHPGSLSRVVRQLRPEAVVHCAALADVDACERQPDLARALNSDLPAELGELAAGASLRVIAVSTDLVLGGTRAHSPPDAPAAPLMHYGRTKLDGERRLLDAAPEAAVVRVALIVGRGAGPRASASEALERAVRSGRAPRLFTDQYRSPIDAESIALAVETLLERPAAGLFHLGGPERVSRYELGRRLAAARGFDPAVLVAVRQSDEPPAIPRPLDVSLDSSRAERELGWTARPLDEVLGESRDPAGAAGG